MEKTNILEKGDCYFFYRSKIDHKNPASRNDIARFYMVLNPDIYSKMRLFVIGKKRMPKVSKADQKAARREWMMNVGVLTAKQLRNELRPSEYETKTKGERIEPGAIPCAAGRYTLVEREGHTELAIKVQKPQHLGKVQTDLGIKSKASYIISVRNPEIQVEGFPDAKPDFPQKLEKKFVGKRWIDIKDPKLLNYEDAQFLLVGAYEDFEETKVNVTGRQKLLSEMEISKKSWPMGALDEGEWVQASHDTPRKSPEGDRTKGGKRGGKKALEKGSAAGVAKALKGIDLPKNSPELVDYAEKHAANQEVLEIIKSLPMQKYKTMADIQKAVGKVR